MLAWYGTEMFLGVERSRSSRTLWGRSKLSRRRKESPLLPSWESISPADLAGRDTQLSIKH